MKRAAIFVLSLAMAAIVLAMRDTNDTSARGAASGAAARTLLAGSSRFTVTVEAAQSLPSFAPPVIGEGVMDYVRHRGRITYADQTELIFDQGVTYVKWPLPWHAGPRWLRVERDSIHTNPLDLRERAMHNPSGLLELLTGASNDAHGTGRENVRGTPTRRIEGSLELKRLVDQSPPDQRAELQDWLNVLAEDSSTTVSFQVWIDNDGVARRLRINENGGVIVTIEYYDFGVQVANVAPPPRETLSQEELVKEVRDHIGQSNCGSNGNVRSGSSTGKDNLRTCSE